jgi:hypothetical protein
VQLKRKYQRKVYEGSIEFSIEVRTDKNGQFKKQFSRPDVRVRGPHCRECGAIMRPESETMLSGGGGGYFRHYSCMQCGKDKVETSWGEPIPFEEFVTDEVFDEISHGRIPLEPV